MIIMLVNSSVLPYILRALQKGHSSPSLASNLNDTTAVLLVDTSTNVLRIQFLLDISPILKQEVQLDVNLLYFQVC